MLEKIRRRRTHIALSGAKKETKKKSVSVYKPDGGIFKPNSLRVSGLSRTTDLTNSLDPKPQKNYNCRLARDDCFSFRILLDELLRSFGM